MRSASDLKMVAATILRFVYFHHKSANRHTEPIESNANGLSNIRLALHKIASSAL